MRPLTLDVAMVKKIFKKIVHRYTKKIMSTGMVKFVRDHKNKKDLCNKCT